MRATILAPLTMLLLLIAACGGTAEAPGVSSSPGATSPAPTGTAGAAGSPVPSACAVSEDPTSLGLISKLRLGEGGSRFPAGEPITMTLVLTNCGDNPTRLYYSTSQRYDFVVEDEDDQELWRWSDGRVFAQVTGEEVIQPGETVSYSETWDQTDLEQQPLVPGVYQALGFSVGCGSAEVSGCHFGPGKLFEIEP